MYDYELSKDEEVAIISDDALLKKGDNFFKVTVIVTNQRFLILELPTDLEEFRFGKVINYPIKKEIIFEVPIENIVEVLKEGKNTKYVLDDTNYFYLNDDKIYDYFLEN